MDNITELLRLDAPAPRPQALAFDGETLWMSSITSQRMYALDWRQWTVRDEFATPHVIWGATVVGDELRVVFGRGPADADDRVIARYIPGHGIKADGEIACPDGSGSHLSYDGDRLYLSQWYKQRIVSLGEHGEIGSTIDLPRQICGHTVVGGRFYCVTTSDEASNDYFLTRVDARNGGTPEIVDLARIPFQARALAFDGEHFWTNHREMHETVAFTRPD
jgi:hypothetical protein